MERIPLKTIFLANSGGFSSKRIVGVFSYIVCIGLLIYATITEKLLPEFADLVIIMSSSLLGIDAFKDIFSRKSNTEE